MDEGSGRARSPGDSVELCRRGSTHDKTSQRRIRSELHAGGRCLGSGDDTLSLSVYHSSSPTPPSTCVGEFLSAASPRSFAHTPYRRPRECGCGKSELAMPCQAFAPIELSASPIFRYGPFPSGSAKAGQPNPLGFSIRANARWTWRAKARILTDTINT